VIWDNAGATRWLPKFSSQTGWNLFQVPPFASQRERSALEEQMGKGLLLWLIGIPLPIILLIWLFGGLH